MAGCDWRLYNVIFLGLSFTFIFTAFQTCCMVEQTVIKGAKDEKNSTFTGDGYASLGIIYGVFALSNWIAPSIIAVTGPKISMFIGGVFYCLFIISFLKPMNWTLYTGSVLVGLGAAVMWTAQGNFLTLNSDHDTMGRNSGIFWALLQCSLLFGNLYTYFAFGDEVDIDKHTRIKLFVVLSAVGAVGLILIVFLRRPPRVEREPPDSDSLVPLTGSLSSIQSTPSALDALKKSFSMFKQKDMLLLSVIMAYTGFELTFWSGVYGTSVGATQQFGSKAKSLLGLVGMAIGVGEILGGSLFGLLGKRTNQHGRDPVVLIGYLSHVVAIYLVFLSLPADSPLVQSSSQPTYIPANEYVILFCGFLFGFGDSSFNTQLYSIVGNMYPDDSAPAFAIFKFVQSVAAAVGFLYSQYLLLHWQLLIMVVFGTAGTACFFTVEWSIMRNQNLGYQEISSQVNPVDARDDDSDS